ncbi:MAG TPA: nitrogenase cofactor biosynthesis protein NifB [Dissulfurispiraceae bacterium]|nr:nitrogenase cofactor biosynthesis protein NifB [Dissulfurispiraceae bacterium]
MSEPLAIRKNRDIMNSHPCFSKKAHSRFGRVHLPVAPACNIQCRYCIRKYDCAHESRPGITSIVLTPEEALFRVSALVERNERLSVVGIAGPGDPLANEATFETFRMINRKFPDLILCASTNGLGLPDRLDDIVKCGIGSITVTISAARPETAEKIYAWAVYRGKKLTGAEAAERIFTNQWRGLTNAIDAGLMVKVNSVLIPGVNDAEIPQIAELAGSKGADLHNILPLIPQAEFAHIERPGRDMIHNLRAECGKYVEQMTHCRQCRADACGILGEDKDMELEVLSAAIGEQYEMIN